jgi:hypothetical protein
MCSPTSLPRDIVGSSWIVMILAAIGCADRIRIPFDSEVRAFALDHKSQFERLLTSLASGTGGDPRVFCIAIDEAPWLPVFAEPWLDQLGLDNEIGLATREYKVLDYANPSTVRLEVSKGIATQCVSILDCVVKAMYCFKVLDRKPELAMNHFVEWAKRIVDDLAKMAEWDKTMPDAGLAVGTICDLWLREAFAEQVKSGILKSGYEQWATRFASELEQDIRENHRVVNDGRNPTPSE